MKKPLIITVAALAVLGGLLALISASRRAYYAGYNDGTMGAGTSRVMVLSSWPWKGNYAKGRDDGMRKLPMEPPNFPISYVPLGAPSVMERIKGGIQATVRTATSMRSSR